MMSASRPQTKAISPFNAEKNIFNIANAPKKQQNNKTHTHKTDTDGASIENPDSISSAFCRKQQHPSALVLSS